MIVTLGALHREAEPSGAHRGHTIDGIFEFELLVVDAALAIGQRHTEKAGGDTLFRIGVRLQVTGELIDGELIEGHIAIECVDHPIALW